MAEAEPGGERHRRQHVGGVEMTEDDAIADVGPGGLADEIELQPLGLGETEIAGDHQGGAVDQRNEADAQALERAAGGGRAVGIERGLTRHVGRPPLALPQVSSLAVGSMSLVTPGVAPP